MIIMNITAETASNNPLLAAVLLAVFSLVAAFATMPILFFHSRHLNIGAAFLTAWITYLNLQSFNNAIIWSNDNVSSYFSGHILCSVESKLIIGSQVGVPSALFCMLRALATVMWNAENPQLMPTKSQKIRNTVFDLTCCIVPPILAMIGSWITAPAPYEVLGIAGCIPSAGQNWLTIVLVLAPPLLWSLVNGMLCGFIVRALIMYRERLSSVMRNGNTTKARFFRLFAICGVYVVALIPLATYVFVRNLLSSLASFSWSDVHHSTNSGKIGYMPSGGQIFFDRFIWLGMAGLVFIFFGLNSEACALYRTVVLVVGLGKVFPSLDRTNQKPKPEHADHRCTFKANWHCKHCRFNLAAFVEALIPRIRRFQKLARLHSDPSINDGNNSTKYKSHFKGLTTSVSELFDFKSFSKSVTSMRSRSSDTNTEEIELSQMTMPEISKPLPAVMPAKWRGTSKQLKVFVAMSPHNVPAFTNPTGLVMVDQDNHREWPLPAPQHPDPAFHPSNWPI